MPAIRVNNVEKIFKVSGRTKPTVLRLNLFIEQGEFVCIAGRRGAGTSNALRLICGEIMPDRGKISLGHRNLTETNDRRRHFLENSFGKVWQYPSLLPDKTRVVDAFLPDNWFLALKMRLFGRPRIEKALALVGLKGCGDLLLEGFTAAQLRRIEVAKAIVGSPPVVIIDDLSDALDEEDMWDVVQLLRELNRRGTTIIMAAHSGQFINILRPRVIILSEGKIKSDERVGKFGDSVNL